MKIQEILNLQPVLQGLLDVKLPIKVAYRLNKLTNKLASEMKFYEEKRLELIKELGEKVKDKDGKETEQIQVLKENEPEFYEELKKVLELEIEIDYEPISLTELGDIQIESKFISPLLFKEQNHAK